IHPPTSVVLSFPHLVEKMWESSAWKEKGRNMDVWQKIKARLSGQIPWESFQSWFTQTTYRGEQGSKLLVAVPNVETKEWIEREFRQQVLTAIRDLDLRFVEVEFVVAGSDEVPDSSPMQQTEGAAAEPLFGGVVNLNPKYDFAHFVVGSSNQFAHAAAKA